MMGHSDEYREWFRQESPHHYSVRGTLFRVDGDGDVYVPNSHPHLSIAHLSIRQEQGEPVEGAAWYDQPVTWTVEVWHLGELYEHSEVGTASPYDETRERLLAHGLDALREAMGIQR